jgi:hypothetical protein
MRRGGATHAAGLQHPRWTGAMPLDADADRSDGAGAGIETKMSRRGWDLTGTCSVSAARYAIRVQATDQIAEKLLTRVYRAAGAVTTGCVHPELKGRSFT